MFLRYGIEKKEKGKHHVSLIRKHIFISMLGNKSEITYTKAKKKKKRTNNRDGTITLIETQDR